MTISSFALAALLVSWMLPAPAVADIDINSCGVEIPPGETGTLTTALSCSSMTGFCIECASPQGPCEPGDVVCDEDSDCTDPVAPGCAIPAAVTLRRGATLDMNGHSIDAGDHRAIRCSDANGACTIRSSSSHGDITGDTGIHLARKAKATISDVDIHDCGTGISSLDLSARVTAINVSASGNDGHGIVVGSLTGTNVAANDNGGRGISCELGKVEGSTITANDNGDFGVVSGKRARITGLTATGNGSGVPEGSGTGLWALRGAILTDSTLTGNVYQDAGGPVDMDILSGRKLILIDTTCGYSGGSKAPDGDWDVCLYD